MLTFPLLKTGVAVQYPFQVSESFAIEVLQFLAGDEQRYLTNSGSLRKWRIRLDLLDEAELKSIEAFFVSVSGAFEAFSFTDPASGTVYPNCFLTEDELVEQFQGELRTTATLTIQQGKS